MDTQLLAQARREELEREVAQLHLTAAAKRAEAGDRESSSKPAKTAAVIGWRLLRALGLAS